MIWPPKLALMQPFLMCDFVLLKYNYLFFGNILHNLLAEIFEWLLYFFVFFYRSIPFWSIEIDYCNYTPIGQYKVVWFRIAWIMHNFSKHVEMKHKMLLLNPTCTSKSEVGISGNKSKPTIALRISGITFLLQIDWNPLEQ